MGKQLLSGNEAIAQGAWEAGVEVGAAYPGTPSTETLENLVTKSDVYCEWSPNEKVAMEVAIGASFAGVRAMASMKHVGVNVAADPLYTMSYTGVNAGLVIVVADDDAAWRQLAQELNVRGEEGAVSWLGDVNEPARRVKWKKTPVLRVVASPARRTIAFYRVNTEAQYDALLDYQLNNMKQSD